jgi:hypothetical protein
MDHDLVLSNLWHRLCDHIDLVLFIVGACYVCVLVLDLGVRRVQQAEVPVGNDLLGVIMRFVVRQRYCWSGSDGHFGVVDLYERCCYT